MLRIAFKSAVASAECRVPTGWTSIYPGVDGDIKQLGIKGALKKFLGVEKFDRPLESYSPDEFQEAYTQMGVRAVCGSLTIPDPIPDPILSANANPNYHYARSNSGTGSNPNDHYVSPYTTKRGTYVPGHYQTNPNSTQRDNYNTRGNVNPHTGAIGTRSAKR